MSLGRRCLESTWSDKTRYTLSHRVWKISKVDPNTNACSFAVCTVLGAKRSRRYSRPGKLHLRGTDSRLRRAKVRARRPLSGRRKPFCIRQAGSWWSVCSPATLPPPALLQTGGHRRRMNRMPNATSQTNGRRHRRGSHEVHQDRSERVVHGHGAAVAIRIEAHGRPLQPED